MNKITKTDIKIAIQLLVASSIISLPYFLYNFKHALMAILVLATFSIINKQIFVFIAFYSILVNAFFLHLVPTWGKGSLVSRIEASYESAKYERLEYFKTYFDLNEILLITFYILISLLTIYWVMKRQRLSYRKRLFSIFSSFMMIGVSLLIYPTEDTIENFQLIHLPLNIYKTNKNLNVINTRTDYLKTINKTKNECPNLVDKVVIILGESVNKNNMSIYGYKRKTTPFFEELKPYAFNAISPGNQTRIAIPFMLTDAIVGKYNKFYKTESIVTKLSQCGYKTHWISNQGKSGEHDTTVTSIAKEADKKYFLNDLDYSTAGFDENVLKTLEKININSNDKEVFFFHLIGSHFAYDMRYPNYKRQFKGNDRVTYYDNSIYYTDSIIREVHEKFLKLNTLFVYVADHGEVVIGGHGYSPSYKDEYEVPLVVWGANQDRIDKLFVASQNKIINTESFNHIIKYLTGIENDQNASYSSKVISLLPGNVVDYKDLPLYDSAKK